MKINEVTKIIVEQSATEVWDQIKAQRDTLPKGPERVRLSNLMNQINKSTTSPERAAEILADAGLGGRGPDDGSRAGQAPNRSVPAATQAAIDSQAAGTLDPEQNVFLDPAPAAQAGDDISIGGYSNQTPGTGVEYDTSGAARTAPTAPAPAAQRSAGPNDGSRAGQAPNAQPPAPAATPPAQPEPTATRPQPTRPGQQTSGANFGAITRNLRSGSRGEGVKALQQRLGINADGIFGPQTDQAVKQFQQKNNLQVDGIVGAQTLAALQGGTAAPGRITAAPATSVRPQARPTTQNASKENMGNKINEANMNISVNGDSAAEVAELLRIMQLSGAPSAKPVGVDDINQGPKPCPICGKVHTGMPMPGGCGSKSAEPDMGSMIKMISGPDTPTEEEEMDGGFGDATTEPEEYTSANAGDVSDMIPSGDDLHKSKKSYPATAGGDNPMNVESSIKETLLKALAEKKAKPDFLDVDKDGNKKEPMKKAVADKKKKAPVKEAKPDFLDMDKDGDKKEPMKKAVADKKRCGKCGQNTIVNTKKGWHCSNCDTKKKTDESMVEGDVPSNFEINPKYKEIIELGRKMETMSQNMSGTDDTSLMMANALGRLGPVLSRFGTGYVKNMNDVVKASALSKEIVQMLMKKAKAS